MMKKELKILLIKRGALGDLLLATPLMRQLKSKLSCRLELLVGSAAAVAVAGNPFIDRLYSLPDGDFSPRGFWRLSQWLLSHRYDYDYVFNLDKHWYFNLLSRICRAKAIGYSREAFSQYLLTAAVSYTSVERYHVHYYLDLLQASGLAAPDYSDINLELTISLEAKAKVGQLLARRAISRFVVVVNSGGNNAYESSGIRMLPRNKIIELLSLLLAAGKEIILLGSNLDGLNYQSYLQDLRAPPQIHNLAAKLTLAESAYLISQADKFYTTDCGAMHLGVAMQLQQRLVAFFGPSNPRHILPESYLKDSALWSDQSCYHPDYQLSGRRQNPEPEYFQGLELSAAMLD